MCAQKCLRSGWWQCHACAPVSRTFLRLQRERKLEVVWPIYVLTISRPAKSESDEFHHVKLDGQLDEMTDDVFLRIVRTTLCSDTQCDLAVKRSILWSQRVLSLSVIIVTNSKSSLLAFSWLPFTLASGCHFSTTLRISITFIVLSLLLHCGTCWNVHCDQSIERVRSTSCGQAKTPCRSHHFATCPRWKQILCDLLEDSVLLLEPCGDPDARSLGRISTSCGNRRCAVVCCFQWFENFIDPVHRVLIELYCISTIREIFLQESSVRSTDLENSTAGLCADHRSSRIHIIFECIIPRSISSVFAS